MLAFAVVKRRLQKCIHYTRVECWNTLMGSLLLFLQTIRDLIASMWNSIWFFSLPEKFTTAQLDFGHVSRSHAQVFFISKRVPRRAAFDSASPLLRCLDFQAFGLLGKRKKVNMVSKTAGQGTGDGRGGVRRDLVSVVGDGRRSDAAGGHQQRHDGRDDGRSDGVRAGTAVAGAFGGVQQRVLELLADVLGVHPHAVVAVRIARAAALGPRVQLLSVVRRPVPFVRHADVQLDCERTTDTNQQQRPGSQWIFHVKHYRTRFTRILIVTIDIDARSDSAFFFHQSGHYKCFCIAVSTEYSIISIN